ncbi:MAG: hypothetical protein IJW70_02780 [Clostridia bacterium]|nr:hypothetical protein [Clostridia bacterium]
MMLGQIISVAVIVSLAVLGLIFVLRGLHRGLIKALMTTGNLVLSAFLACFLSRDFTTIARDYVYPLFVWVTGLFGLSLEQELAEFDGIVTLLPLLVGVLVTPLLFLVFFGIFRAIIGFALMFVYKPKRKTVDEEGNTVKIRRYVPLWSRISGAAVGVLNAFLLLAILLLPIGGYANMICNVSDVYFADLDSSSYSREGSGANEKIYFIVQDYVSPVRDNWFFKVSYGTIGRPLFNHMTSTAYKGGEFGLENETVTAIDLLRSLQKFSATNFATSPQQSVDALGEMVETLEQAVLMPDLMASLIAELCDNWAQGGSLMGIARPQLGELLDPTFDVLLNIMTTVDGETLIADLNTLVDVLDMMVEYKIFSNLGNSEALMDTMSQNPDMLKKVMGCFEENEHLAPMAIEIKRLCVRAVTQSLDMGDSELTGKLTESINANKDQPERLSQALTEIVQDYLGDQDVTATVSPELVDEVAEAIVNEFAGQDIVTEEEVIDFVLNYASGNLMGSSGSIDLDGDGIPDGDLNSVPNGSIEG